MHYMQHSFLPFLLYYFLYYFCYSMNFLREKKSVFYFVLRQSIICIFSFLQAPTSFFVRAKHSIGVYPNVPPEQIGSLEWWRWSTQNSQHSMSTATAKLLYIPFTIDLTVYSQLGLKFSFFLPSKLYPHLFKRVMNVHVYIIVIILILQI